MFRVRAAYIAFTGSDEKTLSIRIGYGLLVTKVRFSSTGRIRCSSFGLVGAPPMVDGYMDIFVGGVGSRVLELDPPLELTTGDVVKFVGTDLSTAANVLFVELEGRTIE